MIEIEPKVADAILWIVGIFEKHSVPYQISGGVAARLYGATRPINDIDIDIPRDGFEKILSDVQAYLTAGPEQYKDKKWDIYSMELVYNNQVIDISAAEAKIFDDSKQEWVNDTARIDQAADVPFNGMVLKVCPREWLIAYKKLLTGEHQKQDIEEIS